MVSEPVVLRYRNYLRARSCCLHPSFLRGPLLVLSLLLVVQVALLWRYQQALWPLRLLR